MKSSTIAILVVGGVAVLWLTYQMTKTQGSGGLAGQASGLFSTIGSVVGGAQSTAYGITTGGIHEIGGELSAAGGEVRNFFGSLFG